MAAGDIVPTGKDGPSVQQRGFALRFGLLVDLPGVLPLLYLSLYQPVGHGQRHRIDRGVLKQREHVDRLYGLVAGPNTRVTCTSATKPEISAFPGISGAVCAARPGHLHGALARVLRLGRQHASPAAAPAPASSVSELWFSYSLLFLALPRLDTEVPKKFQPILLFAKLSPGTFSNGGTFWNFFSLPVSNDHGHGRPRWTLKSCLKNSRPWCTTWR